MESRHCGQDKRIFLCPVHNASTPCSLQAFGIRCIADRLYERSPENIQQPLLVETDDSTTCVEAIFRDNVTSVIQFVFVALA